MTSKFVYICIPGGNLEHFDRAYKTCMNIACNCVPWKVVDGKLIQLPPLSDLKFCEWPQLDKTKIYDLIFVSSKDLEEKLNNVTKYVAEHGKIYVVFDGSENKRRQFVDKLSGCQIGLIDERIVGEQRHFVFRPPRYFRKPVWEGQRDCTVFVHDGAGFGDEFFFGRFVDLLHSYNCKAIFEARTEIYRFTKCFSKYDKVVLKGGKEDFDYDFQANIDRIERVFGRTSKTKLPYFNAVVPESHRLPSGRMKIGFLYKGGFTKYRTVRDYNLSDMEQLKSINADLYCLQKNFNYELKNESVQDWYVDLSDRIQDWYDTACYVSQMDYVVTPDTSMLHLAAALGIKTKVFLKEEHSNSYIGVNQTSCVFYPYVVEAFWGDDAITNVVKGIKKEMIL